MHYIKNYREVEEICKVMSIYFESLINVLNLHL